MKTSRLLLLMAPLLISPVMADWTQVTSLDIPVTQLSPNPSKAQGVLEKHFLAQIAANEAFLKKSPQDPHAWESRVRLASAQGRLASLRADRAGVQQAIASLKKLEREVPDDSLKAEAMFRRISLQWQDLGLTADLRRENAVANARTFAAAFPKDRRSPRLLAEAAALCNTHPEEKRKLLEEAASLNPDDAISQRLADERKQLDQLGKPVTLSFNTLDGTPVDLAQEHGQVTALVFWSAESAPSLVWMKYFAKFAGEQPGLRVVTVSLDRNKADLISAMRSLNINWPTGFDGKGWENEIARNCGINTLPTLWLISKKGILSYLNARDSYEHRIKELLLQN
jgi:hypothetical protein